LGKSKALSNGATGGKSEKKKFRKHGCTHRTLHRTVGGEHGGVSSKGGGSRGHGMYRVAKTGPQGLEEGGTQEQAWHPKKS